MTKIRITKEFDFEMAHALKGYDGPCKQMHGHSYGLRVTVIGEAEKTGTKRGMVMDYGDLKAIVERTVVKPFDHALMLGKDHEGLIPKESQDLFSKVWFVDYQPTSEMMLVDIVARISRELPDHLKLHSVWLRETARSWAEWYAEDNA